MTDPKRIAGTVEVTVNGSVTKVTGNISINLGQPMREVLVGPDGVHGYKEVYQAASVEGEGRIIYGMSIKDFVNTTQATVVVKNAYGKLLTINNAWFEGEGVYSTEEGTLPFKFVGETGEEIG